MAEREKKITQSLAKTERIMRNSSEWLEPHKDKFGRDFLGVSFLHATSALLPPPMRALQSAEIWSTVKPA